MSAGYALSTGILVLYFVILLYIGMFSAKKWPATNLEDYVLGGRGATGYLIAGLCLMATQYSALTFLGFPGMMYSQGLGPYVAIAGMYMMFAAFVWMLIGARIWKIGKQFNHITPSDTLAHYFESRNLGYVVGVVLFLALLPYLQTQIMGVAYLMEVATGGFLKYTVGAVLVYVIVFIYVYFGGMKAILFTDAMQGVMLLGGIAFGAVALIYVAGGGFYKTFADVMASPSAVKLTIPGPAGVWTNLFVLTWAIPVGIGWMSHPHMWFRMHIPKSVKFLRMWPLIITLTFPIVMGGGFLTASAAMATMPGVKTVDSIVILMFDKFFPPVVLGLLAAAALAAMMSSLSGQLHGLGAMTVQDFFKKLAKKPIEPKREVFLTRMVIAVAATIGLYLSFVNPAILVIIGGFSAALGGQVTIIAICAVGNFRWVTRCGAMAGVIGGVVVMFLTGIKAIAPWGMHPYGIYAGSWGLMANVALVILVSAITQSTKPSDSTVNAYKQIGW